MNVDVSPDGETLIFDLLGDIYRLPTGGGDAEALTSGRAWDQAPRFSLDGTEVYFVSDREGFKNIWRLTLSDQSVQQVTRSNFDILGGPNWSQEGTCLLAGVAASAFNVEIILQSIDPNNGDMFPIDAPSGPWIDVDTFERHRPPIQVFSAVESADGEVFFSQGYFDEKTEQTTLRLYEFDLRTQTRTVITPVDALYNEYKPQLSRDGNLLAYFRQYKNRRTEIRVLNRTTGRDEALIELKNADDVSYGSSDDSRPNYAFTPDNEHLVYWHGGKIHRVNLADGSSAIIPFRVKVQRDVWTRAQPAVQHIDDTGEVRIIRWPSVSGDGQTMAFAAIGHVWVMDLTTSTVRRLTRSSDFEYMPSLSRDGQSVAYVSFAQSDADTGSGRLMVADLDGSPPREVLAAPTETYLLPKWSPDGSMIAMIREVQGDGGLDATFGWTLAAGGGFHEIASAPASSDRASFFVYARHVGFDESSDKLVISFPQSKTKTVLASVSLDGSAQRTLAIGTSEIGGITPAPDLKNLVLTRHDGTVWTVPFDVGEEGIEVSTLTPDARRVSENGGYYVNWNNRNRITLSFAQNVYQYRLQEGELESLRVQMAFEKPQAAQPIAFKGARLITISDDGSVGPEIESGTVMVDGQRITAIGPVSQVAIPADAVIIDATGKTIMPSLLDTHYHRIGGFRGGGGMSAFKIPNPDFSDPSAIEYGVTTVWEPGGPTNDGVPATADLQAAGRILGPRWSHSATGSVGFPFEHLTTYAAALAAVEQHHELGVDVLKEYATPTREQRQWLSSAAHEKGMGIVSHLETFDSTMTQIIDGYTGGDHPYIPVPFFKDVHELMRQTGYIWTPNLVITSGTMGTSEDKRTYFCLAVLEWRRRMDRATGERNPICDPDQDIPTVPYDTHRVSRVAKQAASAANNGVHIGVSAHNLPGSNLHREMWFLWKGGLPIKDVLRATTIGNAEKLGLQEEVGSLGPGKIADFLVLDENPLDDILNTLTIRYTVQGGVVYDSATAERVDVSTIAVTVKAANDDDASALKTGTNE